MIPDGSASKANPCRHPDLRLKFVGPGGRRLGRTDRDTWFEVPAEVEALVALCDGTLSTEELIAQAPWGQLGPGARGIVVRKTLAQLEQRGLIVTNDEDALEWYFRSYGHPSVHRTFVSDSARTDLYRQAILELVQPGDVVIDIGTGTGILAMFAAQAGASVVHAIEPTPIIEHAKALAKTNGFEQIVFHRADALELELDVQADVILADWIGHFVIWERIFPAVARLRDRCLKPEGRLFPMGVDLQVAPLCDSKARSDGPEFWSTRPYDLDFSLLRDLEYEEPPQTKQRRVSPAALLAPAQVLREFSAQTLNPKALRAFKTDPVTYTVSTDGHLDGFCGFFTAHLAPGLELCTGPGASPTFYDQQVFPVRPLPVHAGDQLRLTLAVSGVEVVFQGALLREGAADSPFRYAFQA